MPSSTAPSSLNPVQERSATLVIATFATREAAAAAAAALPERQASVIGPGDRLAARKLEPDSKGIFRTILRSHLVLGLAGALLGAAFGYWLTRWWPAAEASPAYALLATVFFGAIVGMLVAGVVSIRPDHVLLIREAKAAIAQGRWVLAVRPTDAAGTEAAMAALRAAGAEPRRSL